MYVEEMPFDYDAEIALISAKTYKFECSLEIPCEMQKRTLLFLDTAARPNLLSKSIVSSLWRCENHHSEVALLRTAKKNLLELEGVELLHVHTGGFHSRVWFAVASELPVNIHTETCSRNLCVHGICSST